jgi:alkanesulfonate monooxygenase SsuD/methylene tetrahydromethanopterin reductase-like flavin-dependent oxidoreductase (luciferase family)
LSKPEQKFSELHKRADELATRLGTEAEVIAAVFTAAATTQSEAQHAAEHQIALVGRDGLSRLLNLLQSLNEPNNVVEWLRQLRNASISLPHWPWAL